MMSLTSWSILVTELISKLSPQSCQPMRLSGIPGVNAADLSHACASINGIGYHLVLIKYSDDQSGYEKLRDLLIDRIKEEAQKGKWKRRRLPCLVHLSISEYTGTRIFNDRSRAKAIGVHPSVWSRIWKDKYKRLFEIMNAYEESALHSIKNKLS